MKAFDALNLSEGGDEFGVFAFDVPYFDGEIVASREEFELSVEGKGPNQF